jgi:hypothetical protein
MPNSIDPFFHYLLGAVFSGLGLFTLILVPFGIRKSKGIQHWPSTPGAITESTIMETFGHAGRIEEPKLSYTYILNGREYVGHTIAITEVDSSSRQAAQDKIAPYPVGRQFEVFYNPEKPEDAVLEKQSSPVVFVMFGIVGAVFITVGILIILNLFKF